MTQNIIHIGCPKTGSTFLQKYFIENKCINIDFDELKEFRKTGVLDACLKEKDVVQPFRVISAEQFSVPPYGFLNPGMSYKKYDVNALQDKIAKELSQIFPDAKILMVVRGYESLLPSLYAEYLVLGGILKYSDFLKTYRNALASHFNYDYLIKIYKQYFGGDNMLILPYELLKNDPNCFLSIIEEKFGFEHHPFSIEKINKAIQVKYIPYVLKMNKLIYRLIILLPISIQKKGAFLYAMLLRYIKNKWLNKGSSAQVFEDNGELVELVSFLKLKSIHLSNQKYIAPFKDMYC